MCDRALTFDLPTGTAVGSFWDVGGTGPGRTALAADLLRGHPGGGLVYAPDDVARAGFCAETAIARL